MPPQFAASVKGFKTQRHPEIGPNARGAHPAFDTEGGERQLHPMICSGVGTLPDASVAGPRHNLPVIATRASLPRVLFVAIFPLMLISEI
jgi:hypothetical protein